MGSAARSRKGHQQLPQDGTELIEPRADLTPWRSAPRERTRAYRPVFASVSKAVQTALRAWADEWFQNTPGILSRKLAAQTLLVYQAIPPFVGRPTVLTYDVQQPKLISLALRSARTRLPAILAKVATRTCPWQIRERYFPYLAEEIVAYISLQPGHLLRMFHAETGILNAFLRFAISDGSKAAERQLRSEVSSRLRRFSKEFDLSPRAEELLVVATLALRGYRESSTK